MSGLRLTLTQYDLIFTSYISKPLFPMTSHLQVLEGHVFPGDAVHPVHHETSGPETVALAVESFEH